jgi:hypothetical protein
LIILNRKGANGSAKQLKESIGGYVHTKFTDTRGGTELGVRLDQGMTDLSEADFGQSTGPVHLEGNLTLNYVRVCCADADLATLEGKGHLEILEE